MISLIASSFVRLPASLRGVDYFGRRLRGIPGFCRRIVGETSSSSLDTRSRPSEDGHYQKKHQHRQELTAKQSDDNLSIIDVDIVEVGPRDGLQNEPTVISARDKIDFIKKLTTNANVRRIEIGSFVSPKWVPQMATTSQVLDGLADMTTNDTAAEQYYSVLVPNLKGLANAIPYFRNRIPPHDGTTAEQGFRKEAGAIDEIAIFASASEGFSEKNLGCSIDESLLRFREVFEKLQADGYDDKTIKIRGYVSCVIACPYDGPTPPSQVARVAESLLDMGCYEVSLGDTTGVGTPGSTRPMIQEVQQVVSRSSLSSSPSSTGTKSQLALHCHDTYGQALANILVGIEEGITTIDSSVAGLGGCPYAKGASGNVATEDVVYMLYVILCFDWPLLYSLVCAWVWVCTGPGTSVR